MKIYMLRNNDFCAITASERQATSQLANLRLKGYKNLELWESELITQGKNFNTWAYNWKKIN